MFVPVTVVVTAVKMAKPFAEPLYQSEQTGPPEVADMGVAGIQGEFQGGKTSKDLGEIIRLDTEPILGEHVFQADNYP